MSAHLPVLPVVWPLAVAVVLLLLYRQSPRVHRVLGQGGAVLHLLFAVLLFLGAADGTVNVYAVGSWQAPFGIVLAVDRVAAVLLLTSSILANICILYASAGTDTEGPHFHAMMQFQLAGVSGAFLTGDLFNLFVFFEILLLASYTLLLHGGGRERTGAAVHYVVLNLAGSALFLIGVGTIYGATGTLNMADLSNRLSTLGPDARAIAEMGALVLLVVFGLKAALVPLHLWLPRTYAVASGPAAAFFALMTKVGVYALLRVHHGVFSGGDAVLVDTVGPWLWSLGVATLVLSAVGAMAAARLKHLLGYMVILSAGTMLTGLAFAETAVVGAVIYYMVHSTVALALVYLLADLISGQRGAVGDRLVPGNRLPAHGRISALFVLGGMAVVGFPPLSGFLGKAMLLDAVPAGVPGFVVWGAVLLGGLLTLLAFGRAGSTLFWHLDPKLNPGRRLVSPAQWASVGILSALLVALVVWAGPIYAYCLEAATAVGTGDVYGHAVLGAQ